jgi:hypothetical protein
MPYVYREVDKLQGQPVVDGGNCVSLIKAYAPGLMGQSTLTWREGARVIDSPNLVRGTAIATFENGRYPRRNVGQGNHAAFFLWHVSDGFWLMDQYQRGTPPRLHIGRRFVPRKGKNANGTYKDPSNNADAFSVIER